MAQKKITIGLVNYNEAACGFMFNGSVCIIEDDGSLQIQRNLTRLLVLFPGSIVEELQPSKPSEQSPVLTGKPIVSEPPPETTAPKKEDSDVKKESPLRLLRMKFK